jgi:hypothetical protein
LYFLSKILRWDEPILKPTGGKGRGSIREGAQKHGESDRKSSAGALHVMQYCPSECRCLVRREYRAILKFVRLGTGLRYEECFGGFVVKEIISRGDGGGGDQFWMQ